MVVAPAGYGKTSLIAEWAKQSKKKVICTGVNCPLCKRGRIPMTRYQVLVINRKTNKVEILEGGPKIFGEIKQYTKDEDYGDPTKYDFKIKKEGSGRETRYTVMAAPKKSDLTSDETIMIQASKSLSEINRIKTTEEIMAMGLVSLSESAFDLEDNSAKSSQDSSSDLEVSDDDWDTL